MGTNIDPDKLIKALISFGKLQKAEGAQRRTSWTTGFANSFNEMRKRDLNRLLTAAGLDLDTCLSEKILNEVTQELISTLEGS